VTARSADFTIREFADYDEIRTCVPFQEEIWGAAFSERVPAAILWVATRTGGVLAGAFDGDGGLAGFVFGLSGWRDGRPVHWSDMLAVHPAARGAGLGRRLKEFQRQRLLENGIRDVFWTFDPLESLNAHLNFSRLGITAREFIPDCYGISDSPLHAGIGTDRLIAHWVLDSDRVRRRMEGAESPPDEAAVERVPVINEGDDADLGLTGSALRLRIPADIQSLKAADPARALVWRQMTRAALETYLSRGYEVTELLRGTAGESSYLLRRIDPAGE
jgi:predicted GNAT superfamily acetyltransferase